MPGFSPNNSNNFNGPQMKIDFDAQEKMDADRDDKIKKEKELENGKKIQEAISKYGIGYDAYSRLNVKDDGRVYFDNQTVEEWDAEMKRLDEPEADDYKYGRR